MDGKRTSLRLTRRRFLLTAAPLAGWSLSGKTRTTALPARLQNADSAGDEIRSKLLQLVNAERFLAGVSELEPDDLASRVATGHATDMATGNFISHWGRDGRKPYHRYSFAGGIHATEENVASIDNFYSSDWKDLANDLTSLHVRMHGEKPPRDGHRKAILAPQHTHAGFGFAISERRLRLVEMYVAKYLEVVGFQSRAKRNETLHLSGRLLHDRHRLQQIDVFYEPPPAAPESRFLVTPLSYGLPDEYETLRPRLSGGTRYIDGSSGVIDLKSDGRFHVSMKLFKNRPGIHTIVFWVKQRPSDKALSGDRNLH